MPCRRRFDLLRPATTVPWLTPCPSGTVSSGSIAPRPSARLDADDQRSEINPMTELVRNPSIKLVDLDNPACRLGLLRLWRRSYQAEADLLGIDDFPPLGVSLEALAARPGTFYGVSQGKRLVGAIEVEELGARTRQIAALAVDPAYFRRGMGRRLVEFVLKDSPGRVLVSTSSANTPALTLYRSMGFRQTEAFASPEGLELCSLEWQSS